MSLPPTGAARRGWPRDHSGEYAVQLRPDYVVHLPADLTAEEAVLLSDCVLGAVGPKEEGSDG